MAERSSSDSTEAGARTTCEVHAQGRRAGPTGFLRVGVCTHVPALLHDFGVDPADVLSEFELNTDFMANPDNRMPYATILKLVTACAERTGQEAFGLMLGLTGSIHHLGALATKMQEAKTVGNALIAAREFLALHDTGAIIELKLNGNEAELQYLVIDPDVRSSEQFLDGAIVLCVNVIRELCGPQWKPTQVSLVRRLPKDRIPFNATFKCRIDYNSPIASLRFEKKWLAAPASTEMQQKRHEAESKPPQSLAELVNASCIRRLVANQLPSADDIAAEFDMTRRTLHRKLAHEATTFQFILLQARLASALRLIRDTDIPLTDISYAIGYSEPSAFTRAFHAWFGRPPRDFRQVS